MLYDKKMATEGIGKYLYFSSDLRKDSAKDWYKTQVNRTTAKVKRSGEEVSREVKDILVFL